MPAENEHSMSAMFRELSKGILSMDLPRLRNTVSLASETFAHSQMEAHAIAAKILSKKTDWGKYEIIRAQCMALYHMYLMFYRDPDCETCQRFLRLITNCYQRAMKKARRIETRESV